MMFDDFLSTPDERFWVNTGGHIRTRTDLQKEELLQLLTEAENSYRQILARTLSCDATEAYAHPLVVVRKKPDLGHLKHRPLFLQRQTYDQKSPVKFAWLTRSLATRNWLIGKGAWPEVQRSDGSYYYPAKSPDFNIGEFIESLENDEVVELVYDLLVGENRISIRDGLWAKTIEADFDSVRATIKKELKSSVDDVLHVVFENGIKKERGKVGISPKRRAALHFLFFLAARALVTLPATQVSEQKFGIA